MHRETLNVFCGQSSNLLTQVCDYLRFVTVYQKDLTLWKIFNVHIRYWPFITS